MKNNKFDTEVNLFSFVISKYFPYWPIFLVLVFFSIVGSWIYLYFATPLYKASATLIIRDEEKGVDASELVESMNFFNSKKIVENEIEVIQSRDLIKQVVNELYLYSPVFEKEGLKSTSAYNSSPVRIEMKDPDELYVLKRATNKIFFSVDTLRSEITIKNVSYPMYEWVETPFGVLKFFKNEKKNRNPQNQLYFVLNNPKIVMKYVSDALNVMSADKLSTVVNITYKDPVPARAEEILNHLIAAYNSASVAEINTLAANMLSFIDSRMKDVEANLDSVEAQVQEYKSKEGVVDLSEQGRIYLKSVGENDRRLSDIKLQLAVLDKIENYVVSKDNNAGIVPSTLGVNDELLSNLLLKLYNSEIEYERLRKTVAENNPTLVAIRNEIEKIRPSIIENVRSQRSNLQASLQNLIGSNDEYNSIIKSIPQKERKLLDINRKKAVINELYGYLLQKREETALSYSPNAAESKVVETAESTVLPVSPKPILVFLIAFIVALGIGIIFVFGKEEFNRNILFRSEIEKMIDEPVIAEIWGMKNPGNISAYADSINQFGVDQFRDLNVALGLFGEDSSTNSLLITSSIKGEGKSFISKNLAINLTASDKKVVLMDFDLRSRSISMDFNFLNEIGLTDYLSNSVEPEKIVHPTDQKNLYLVPTGKELPDASNLLVNGRLPALFSFLEKEFDYIILDTPPAEIFSDAYLLAPYCDSTLFIVRQGLTPKCVIKLFDQNNKNKFFNNLCIVFNGVKARGVSKGLYDYGYGRASPIKARKAFLDDSSFSRE